MPGTPLADRPPAPFLREHRLYQTDFLLRRYGFALDEIPFEAGGRLSLAVDPKTAWARVHPERFPVEVNTAEREVLVRVPGIGPASADRILEMRRAGRLHAPEDLRRAGASWRVAAEWLLFDGRRVLADRQLGLWPPSRMGRACAAALPA